MNATGKPSSVPGPCLIETDSRNGVEDINPARLATKLNYTVILQEIAWREAQALEAEHTQCRDHTFHIFLSRPYQHV